MRKLLHARLVLVPAVAGDRTVILRGLAKLTDTTKRTGPLFQPISRRFLEILLVLLCIPMPASAVDLSIEPANPVRADLIRVWIGDDSCQAFDVDDVRQSSTDVFQVLLRADFRGAPICDSLAIVDDAPSLALGPLATGTYLIEVRLGNKLLDTLAFDVLDAHVSYIVEAVETDINNLPWEHTSLFLLEVRGTWGQAVDPIPPPTILREGSLIHVYPYMAEVGPQVPAPYSFQTALGPLLSGFYTVIVHVPLRRPGSEDDPAAVSRPLRVTPEVQHPECETSSTTLCLTQGRFRVSVDWATTGEDGEAGAVPLSPQTGGFWFFHPDNLELVVKVLDGCAAFGRYWVFAAGLTNVGVDIDVVDTETDTTWSHHTEPGQGFEAIRDTDAFLCP